MKFNVVVVRVDEREITRERKHVDTGEILEETHKGRVVTVRTTKGGKEIGVVLWPEDETPAIGSRMKYLHAKGERAILVDRSFGAD